MLCFQALLQSYIALFYYSQIRLPSGNQFLSLIQSFVTIITTLSNVWIPQVVGNRQYVPTLKTKVWQRYLNTTLFNSLFFTLALIGTTRNTYMQLFVVSLYAAICSTLVLHNNYCKNFNPNRLKSCLLTLLFLVKFILMIIFLCGFFYTVYIQGNLDIEILSPVPIFLLISTSITVCMDAFFVYIFGKSALKKHSISSIWNMEPTIISKPLFCTCIFLSGCAFVSTLYLIISDFV